MLHQCAQHGIFPMRIAAIDARKGQSTYACGGERSIQPSGIVPVEVVAMTWDSTVNAKFDKHCVINVTTPMTPSERACAASHVMTWKLIYEIFAHKGIMDPSSELSMFLSSLSAPTLQKKSSSGGAKKQCLKPLPTPHVYDLIPKIWMTQPQPQHQKTLVGDKDRLEELDNICSLLSLKNQSSNFEFYGKFFLILEDDAVIHPHPKFSKRHTTALSKKLTKKDLLQRIKDIEDKIPVDFDICYLGYVGKTFTRTVKKVLVRPQYVWQLHAYLLSPKGAAKLLSHLPVSAPVDNFIAKLIFEKKLEVFIFVSRLF
jgi:GR25 family glycosyltransferase involved in LPS biosynthesis